MSQRPLTTVHALALVVSSMVGTGVFTATKGGLMFEASVGGQKFDYAPFAAQ